MLEQILMQLHNWFCVQDGIHAGEYTIEDGHITLPFLLQGQHFRIMGSLFNDGLHRYGPEMEALTDETFTGSVWALAIPKAVENAAAEAEAWLEKNAKAVDGLFSSESFGGYSYAKDTTTTDSVATHGIPAHIWSKVKQYKKLPGLEGK